MGLYGEDLMKIGIILLAAAILGFGIFMCFYYFKALRLKKRLEQEYGVKNK